MAANEVSITITSKNRVKGGFDAAKRDAESEGSKIEQIWAKHADAISKKMDQIPLKLKLLPAAISAAGGLLPAVAAIGTSFAGAAVTAGVFGKMASSVLSNAGQDATKLADLQSKLADATTAKQKKAIDQQIANLENGWGKSYSQLVTITGQVQKKWQDTSRAITAPVLVPWLDAVSHAMDHLKPLVQPVADLFKYWGQSIDRYFKSKAGSDELNRIATALGKFGAQQMADIGSFILNVGKGIAALGRDLAGHNVDFGTFGEHLVKWGTAFSGWASSDKARADVGKFLTWMHDNGKLVGQILGDIGKVLPNLLTGLGKAGTSQLSALTAFFNLIAGLPPWMQKWVGEGLALFVVSSKALPVISAATALVTKTITLMKTPPSWLGGGKAAAGGAAASGAEGAAGGAAISGSAIAGFAAAGAAIAAGIILKVREDLKKGFTGIIKDIPNWFNFGTLGFISQSAQGWADLIVSKIKHSFMSWEDDVRHFIAGSWDKTRHDAASAWDGIISFLSGSWSKLVADAKKFFGSIPGAISGYWSSIKSGTSSTWNSIKSSLASTWNSIKSAASSTWNSMKSTASGAWNSMKSTAASAWNSIRSTLVSAWNSIKSNLASAWNQMLSSVKSIGGSIVSFVGGLPGKFIKALSNLPAQLKFMGTAAFTDLLNGFKSIAGGIVNWLTGFVGKIVGLIHKLIQGDDGKSKVFQAIGKDMMMGLKKGIEDHAHQVADAAVTAAKKTVQKSSGVSGAGPVGGDAAANKTLARQMFPWPASMWSSYDYLEMREAGYNRFARNPSSGAYGIPQALPPTKMPYAAQAAGGSHAGPQISWMYDYIRSRYGNPVNAAAHERNYNWYASGGATSPGWAVLGERGRELVKLPGGARVYPHGETEQMLGQGGTITVQLEINGGRDDFERFMSTWIKNYVRTKGGGTVQRAFGTGGH